MSDGEWLALAGRGRSGTERARQVARIAACATAARPMAAVASEALTGVDLVKRQQASEQAC